ncbi:hypothetical protein Dimus_035996 [Dionaea muscipula]
MEGSIVYRRGELFQYVFNKRIANGDFVNVIGRVVAFITEKKDFIFNLEIPYEIFFQRSSCICCPYLFMVPDPDMELEWAMPSPMLLVFKPKHLWSVNGLGIGFGSIGLGYSIDDSGIGSSMIYGSIQAGNVDLNPEAMV